MSIYWKTERDLTPHSLERAARSVLEETGHLFYDGDGRPCYVTPVNLKKILKEYNITVATDPDINTSHGAYSFAIDERRYIMLPPKYSLDDLTPHAEEIAAHIGFHEFFHDTERPITRDRNMESLDKCRYEESLRRAFSAMRLFARYLLVPIELAASSDTPDKLAKSCNVPLEMAAAAFWDFKDAYSRAKARYAEETAETSQA